jgi:hypothetical protein
MASDFRSWLELYMSEKQARIQQLACASQQMNQTSAAVGVQQQAHIAQYTLECGDYCLPEQTQSGSAGSSTPDVGEPQPVEPAPRPVCACGQTVWDISLDYDGKPICQDCIADAAYAAYEGKSRGDIDARILAAQRSEPVRDAADWDVWSTAGDES